MQRVSGGMRSAETGDMHMAGTLQQAHRFRQTARVQFVEQAQVARLGGHMAAQLAMRAASPYNALRLFGIAARRLM